MDVKGSSRNHRCNYFKECNVVGFYCKMGVKLELYCFALKMYNDTEMLHCIASRLWKSKTVRSVERHKTANTSKTSRGQKGECVVCVCTSNMYVYC